MFRLSLKTLLRLTMLGISFAGMITRSSGEEDAGSSATPPAAREKVLRDSEADGRLRDALKDTAVDLLEMVPITGGTYRMGSPFDVGSYSEGWLIAAVVGDSSWVNQGPQHEVTVDGFYLGKYEVTVEQFLCFLNAIAAEDQRYLYLHRRSPVSYEHGRWLCEKGREHEAADTVTWDGATAFCDWLSKKTGDTYRLPTEAEWEWAAKGKEGRLYPWGVTLADYPTDEDGWKEFEADIRKRADWGERKRPVGSFPNGATPEGVCDMVGGVWEWCQDWYHMRYDASDQRNPKGPPPVLFGGRVLRGGKENVGGNLTETTTRLVQRADCDRESHIYGMRLLREVRR
jgi:formylglycine-generating enzyme required for sulfatase activity